MILNKDYRDILSNLCEEKAEFLIVGAYAMAALGYPRSTMDIDIWILPDSRNAEAVMRALEKFGVPLSDITVEDLKTKEMVFQIGVAPRRIDLINSLTGLEFESAHQRSVVKDIDGIKVNILSLEDLIINKKAVGRLKDLADVEILEQIKDRKKK